MSWWKFLLPKRASGPQLDSELRFHIDELTQANIARGMPPDEARRRAMLEFGGQEQVKEEVRDVYRVRIIRQRHRQWKIRDALPTQIAVVFRHDNPNPGARNWREQRRVFRH